MEYGNHKTYKQQKIFVMVLCGYVFSLLLVIDAIRFSVHHIRKIAKAVGILGCVCTHVLVCTCQVPFPKKIIPKLLSRKETLSNQNLRQI